MSTTYPPEDGTPSQGLDRSELQWQVDNYDQRRNSIANRASLIFVANSIVFAAIAQGPTPGLWLVRILEVLGLAASLVSLILAVLCTVNLLPQASMFGEADRGIFHPRKARAKYRDAADFAEKFPGSQRELNLNIKHHLWIIMCEYGHRYRMLRYSCMALIAAFALISLANAIAKLFS